MDQFTENNRIKVDFLINVILSYRILVDHRYKKSKEKQKVLSVSRELSSMIAKCFNLIDDDVDEISKIKGIKRTIMTDFLLSSDKTLRDVENIAMRSFTIAERVVPKKFLKLDVGTIGEAKKFGVGWLERKGSSRQSRQK